MSMKRSLLTGLTLGIWLVSAVASASNTPVGVWKTIDDNTGKARSYIQIWENNGVLYGKVVKILDATEPNPKCIKCEGKKKNKPVLGLTIIWGLKKSEEGLWEGGRVLDPESGDIYKCKATMKNGGKKMEFRGFMGLALIGRTQVWERVK